MSERMYYVVVIVSNEDTRCYGTYSTYDRAVDDARTVPHTMGIASVCDLRSIADLRSAKPPIRRMKS